MTPKKIDPPNTGQGQEDLNDQDLDSLPNMDDGEDISGSDDDSTSEGASPDTGQGAQEPDEQDDENLSPIQKLMLKKGFKSEEDLVKSFEDRERKITEQAKAQRLSSLGPPAQTPPLQQQHPVFQQPQPQQTKLPEIEIPDNPDEIVYNKEKFRQFIDNLGNVFYARVQENLSNRELENRKVELGRQINAVQSENPKRFKMLIPTIMDLSRQYPQATVKQLYDEADRIQTEEEESRFDNLMKKRGMDPDRVKALTAKSNAQISTNDGVSGIAKTKGQGADEDEEAEWEAIKRAAEFT